MWNKTHQEIQIPWKQVDWTGSLCDANSSEEFQLLDANDYVVLNFDCATVVQQGPMPWPWVVRLVGKLTIEAAFPLISHVIPSPWQQPLAAAGSTVRLFGQLYSTWGVAFSQKTC